MGDRTLQERVIDLECSVLELGGRYNTLLSDYEALWGILKDHLRVHDRVEVETLVDGKAGRKAR